MDNVIMSFVSFAQAYPHVIQCVKQLRQQGDEHCVPYDVQTGVWYVTADTLLELTASCMDSFNRLVVIVASGVHLECSDQRLNTLQMVRTDIVVLENASCNYIQLGESSVHSDLVQSICMYAAEKAHSRFAFCLLGASSIELTIQAFMMGHGSRSELAGTLVNTVDRTINITTTQHHKVAGGSSNVAIKGIVGNQAKVFVKGTIDIAINAGQTEAFLEHGMMRFGSACTVVSKPILEIANNDVICSHASAIGDVDTAQTWYLQARGLALAQAQRLLLESYLAKDAFFAQKIKDTINSLSFS